MYIDLEPNSSPPRFSRTGREAGTNYGAGVDFATAASRQVFAYKKCTKNEHGGEEDHGFLQESGQAYAWRGRVSELGRRARNVHDMAYACAARTPQLHPCITAGSPPAAHAPNEGAIAQRRCCLHWSKRAPHSGSDPGQALDPARRPESEPKEALLPSSSSSPPFGQPTEAGIFGAFDRKRS